MIFGSEYYFPAFLTISFISIVSKFLATIITFPLVTLRTKAYTSDVDMGVWERLSEVVRKDGVFGLYKGFNTKMAKTLTSNALKMVAFEKARYYFLIAMNYVL